MASLFDWASTLVHPVGSLIDYFTQQSTNEANAQNIAATNATNKAIAEQNVKMQQNTLDWQKAQYQKTLEREDTAMQRGVQDAIAAGLSPLAASPASSSQAPVVSAPQSNYQAQAFQKANPLLGLQTANAVSATMRDIVSNLTEIEKMNIQKEQFSKEFGLKSEQFAHQKYMDQPVHDWNKGRADWFNEHPQDYSTHYKEDLIIDFLKQLTEGKGSPSEIVDSVANTVIRQARAENVEEYKADKVKTIDSANKMLSSSTFDNWSPDDMFNKIENQFLGLNMYERQNVFINWLKNTKHMSNTEINTLLRSGRYNFKR